MLTVPYQSFGVNVAGNAVVDSKPADRRDFLKRLQDAGVHFVRLHHVAENVSEDKISLYCPTYADCEAALPIQLEWLDDCADLGMRCWVTAQARQRVAEDEVKDAGLRETLFGKRPAGVMKGEIADTFFWFPEALAIVNDWVGKVANSVASHPALMVFSTTNEELCGFPFTGLFASGVRNNPDSPTKVQWLRCLDRFQSILNLGDRDMNKSRTAEFHAWNGYTVNKVLVHTAKWYRVGCAVSAGQVWGSASMAALCETAAGDIDDFHLYPYAGQTDPYDPAADKLTQRTFASVACALHREGRELCSSEWADVLELKPPQPQPTHYQSPAVVALAQQQQQMALTCHYAAMQAKLPGKAGAWNAWFDDKWATLFGMAATGWPKSLRRDDPVVTELSYEDVFGWGSGPSFVSPLPGSQPWAMQAAASGKPHRVRLPKLEWMG